MKRAIVLISTTLVLSGIYSLASSSSSLATRSAKGGGDCQKCECQAVAIWWIPDPEKQQNQGPAVGGLGENFFTLQEGEPQSPEANQVSIYSWDSSPCKEFDEIIDDLCAIYWDEGTALCNKQNFQSFNQEGAAVYGINLETEVVGVACSDT